MIPQILNGGLAIISLGEDEDSEDRHYPKITPPVPSVPRTKSQSSGKYSKIMTTIYSTSQWYEAPFRA
jgi:hypothetical protein